ncbi:ATP-binding protein [Pseudoxanthomonas sacheonensis]|uniref:ATP-binding protein n=1 Tax=Pseudoxanthomonas sacheonensis TaxID=443615 RepID=UPI0013D64915|nr:ATP-binding protein [Pseudoxanthomonas sacheonensis]KAF1709658.1 hybrid sensor histidine kinase/response regulator [Pseudoxanthomonas sacheonensis]
MPVAPWLVLAAILLTLVSLLLPWFGIAGPWPWVALASAGVAAFVCVIVALRMRRLAAYYEGTEARAAMAESERDNLQKDLHRHDRLEQQLLLAKQAAESAVLAKGEFLATMSHEIRTPLNGIVPMLDLLSRAALPPDQRDMLNTASASSQQLLRIVDDILDYSKLEANKLELEITGFNLREVLDGVLQLMQRPAENKNIRLNLQLDPAVRLPVRGDPVRMRQVLSNLIGNAVKFTERGTVTVNVRRLGETAAQHLLRFEVRDTGIGIDAEAQTRLFNSFSQADASTTRLYGGTGLGLAICKRIVDLMGGRIGVLSEPGRGSTFWFEVPLLKVIGDMRAQDSSLEPTRALLVGPETRLRQRLSILLPSWGIQLTCVDTTQEALERLRSAQSPSFSIILGDLSSIRASARALHRGITRNNVADKVRMVWLYGDEEIPDELRDGSILLPRQSHGADLHAALSFAPPALQAPVVGFEEIPQRDDPIAVEKTSAAMDPEIPAQSGADAPIAADQIDAPPIVTRLLLVEDNPVNLAVGEKLLSVLGYSCDIAINGQIALEKMATGRYSLVLMDCQMPVLDGYSATREWRDQEVLQGSTMRLPIVAMTANAMAGDRQRCLDAGMDDYLSKPVSREQLENCLQRWLPGRASFGLRDAVQPTPDASVPAAASPQRPSAPPVFPVLDHNMLDELREIAGDETVRIIGLFLEDAPRLIARLESASTVPDLEAMREAAHTLKSSSANVGAMALSTAAKRVELGARAQKLDRPAVAVALVIAEYARARMALQGYIARLDRDSDATAQSSSLVSR